MAESRLNRVSQRVEADPTAAADPTDAVDLLQAGNQYATNLDTLKIGNEMTQHTLDLLA